MMIVKLAWKNVWRNPVRSGVVMAAVATGIWAMIFILSFSQGMVLSYINMSIENRTSHIQIHHPDFIEDPEIQFNLNEEQVSAGKLIELDEITLAAQRIVLHGLVSSAAGSQGAQIKGVSPEAEMELTRLHEKIKEGEFLDTDRRNPVIMSIGLGKKLGVSLNQHVVINFQGTDGDFQSGRFRVVGWYSTGNSRMDEMLVYARYSDLQRVAEMEETHFHEIALNTTNLDEVRAIKLKLEALFPDVLIRTYYEVSPDLAMYNEQIRASLMIVIVVIMLALLFGIINTMLMAVLERIREIGMLMAIGMNRLKIFAMIMMESVLMCVIAAPIGLLLGYTTIYILGRRGVDLSAWSSGLEQFGMSTIIRPELETAVYFDIITALVITAIIAGIYPAFKAVRLKPAVALRKI
jgi:putative ABC transport system permease protein